jgi:hypothetical protein
MRCRLLCVFALVGCSVSAMQTGDRAASGFRALFVSNGEFTLDVYDPEEQLADCCSRGFIRTTFHGTAKVRSTQTSDVWPCGRRPEAASGTRLRRRFTLCLQRYWRRWRSEPPESGRGLYLSVDGRRRGRRNLNDRHEAGHSGAEDLEQLRHAAATIGGLLLQFSS